MEGSIKSRGGIIYRIKDEKIEFLLIKHLKGGHWGFPKGQKEGDEGPCKTAKREVFEEVGLSVRFFDDFKMKDTYTFGRNKKEVIYYLAKVDLDVNISLDEKEIKAFCWKRLEEALKLIYHDSLKYILKKAKDEICKKEGIC